jgi:alcohol dehydrogenase YqhD (iron-dependent ADH family)
MDNFKYHSPTAVYFGRGQVNSLSQEIDGRFKKILIVTGGGSVKRNNIFDSVVSEIKKAGSEYLELTGIKPNPRIKSVYEGVEICKRRGIDLVLGVGGGSVIDASKAIAVGAKYDGDCWDFFNKEAEPKDALSVGCVLTLAATGTETNGNAVITKEEGQRKLALCNPLLRPAFAILDPVYTFTVDKYNTAAGIVDIMAHVFEQYFSHTVFCDVQDGISEAILRACIKYAPVVLGAPDNYDARANIMWAGTLALNGLIGIGKDTDWASHGIEHEISAIYDISHGAGLAVIVPNWMRQVLSDRTAPRIADYGRNVWSIGPRNDLLDIANQAIDKTREFFTSLGMPATLREAGISGKDKFSQMAKGVIEQYKTVGSFKQLCEDDIMAILNASF